MKIRMMLAAAATVLLFAGGAADAQTPAAKPGATTAPKKTATTKPRTAKSIECSRQADEKGLKGNARRKFRAKCKRG